LGKGELLALTGALSYAIVNALQRSVAQGIDPYVGSLIRQLPLFLLATIFILSVRPLSLRPKSEKYLGTPTLSLLFASGVGSFCIGNILLFAGMNWIGLAVAVAASQGGLVLGGAWLSTFVMKEPPVGWQKIGVVVVAFGIVLTALPSIKSISQGTLAILGFAVSFSAGVFFTLSGAVSRSFQKSGGTFLVALAVTNIGGVAALVLAVLVRAQGNLNQLWPRLTSHQLLVLLCAGCVNAVAIASITLAVKSTNVANVSMILSLVLVFGVFTAWIVFGESIPITFLLGATAVLSGVLLGQIGPRYPKKNSES
jgi:drug/metabolite transporter (DMT)-like permease